MQDYDLKDPGINIRAQTLRNMAAKCISDAELEVNPGRDLVEFFVDAASKTPGYIPGEAPLNSDQAVVTDADIVTLTDQNGTSVGAGVLKVENQYLWYAQLPPILAPVLDASSVTIGNTKYTFTVTEGEITEIIVTPVP